MRTPSDRTYPVRLRKILRAHNNGLSVAEICAALNVERGSKTVYAALHRMSDAYIDRWEPSCTSTGRNRMYRAVWCVVEVPEHCPRPGK